MKRVQFLITLAITAVAPIVWGSTYIVTSELLPTNTPLLASTLRALPAGLVLVMITRILPIGIWWWRLFVLAFLNISFFFYCLFFTASHLPGGMAALVMSIQPILVIGLSYLLLNNQLSKQQLFASFIVIFSVALLVINQQATLSLSGLIMGVLGAISMAVGIVMTKLWGRPEGMTLLNFTGWQLFLGGLMLLPIAWFFEGFPQQLTKNNLFGYVYLCIVGAMLAYSLWFNGIDKLPAITVSFLGFLSSVSAVLLGYILLQETLSLLQIMGAIGIFLSIILSAPKTRSTS